MAQIKVLTIEGLQTFAAKVDATFVRKDGSKVLSTNDYTNEDKGKLAGIAAGAQVNVLESVKVNGSALPVDGKAVNIDLSGYATKEEASAIPKFKIEVVSALPTSDISESTIYLMAEEGGKAGDAYLEYIYVNGAWETLGDTRIDLTNYYTKGEVDGIKTTLEGAIATAKTELQAEIDADVLVVSNALATAKSDLQAEIDSDIATAKTQISAEIDGDIATAKTAISAEIDADVKVVDDRVTSEVETINTALGGKVNSEDLVAITDAEINALFA